MNAASSGTLSDFGGASGIGYDGAGNVTSLTSLVTGNAALTGTTNYGYDGAFELTGESSTRGPSTGPGAPSGYTYTNAYDGAGNPTTLRNNAGLSYNADNQLSTDSFDGNGNPTTYSGTAATYNADNELAAYGSALTRDPTGTAGGVNEYAYCGGNPVNGSDPSGGWIRRKIPYVRRGAAGIGAPRNTGSPMTRDPLVSRSRSAPRAG